MQEDVSETDISLWDFTLNLSSEDNYGDVFKRIKVMKIDYFLLQVSATLRNPFPSKIDFRSKQKDEIRSKVIYGDIEIEPLSSIYDVVTLATPSLFIYPSLG